METNKVNIIFRVRPELKKDFAKKCQDNDTRMTDVLIEAIKKYLKK